MRGVRGGSTTLRQSIRVALLACVAIVSAGAQTSSGAAPTVSHELETTHINLEGVSFDVAWMRDRGVSEHKLLVPADAAWAAFPTVFGKLGLDPNIIDSKQMIFGNAGATYRHTIAGQRLSHFIECGNMLGVSTADSYDVWIRLIAQVLPVDGGISRVRVELEAKAKATDRPGGSVSCSSNGALEARIAKMLVAEATKSAQ
jgi:hypothetical protein